MHNFADICIEYPGAPQNNSKWIVITLRNDSKSVQKWPKMVIDDPKTTPKFGRSGTRPIQKWPKAMPKGSQRGQKSNPKTSQNWPKITPFWPQNWSKLENATTKNTHKSLFWSSKVHRNGKNSTLDAFRCTSLLHTFVGAGALLQIPPLPQHPLRNPLLAPVPAPIPASAAAPRGPPSPN